MISTTKRREATGAQNGEEKGEPTGGQTQLRKNKDNWASNPLGSRKKLSGSEGTTITMEGDIFTRRKYMTVHPGEKED